MQPGFWWRGWGMVGLGGLMDFVATGFFFYSYSVFFPVVAAEFGISRSGTSLGMSTFLMVTALAAPVVGRLLNLFPMRNVFSTGALLMGLGLMLVSLAPAAVLLLPGVIFIACGAAALGQIGPPRLVINWFTRNRGLALGMASVGISLSGVVMPLSTTALIGWVGWQDALLILSAIAALFIAPFIFFLVIEHPQDVGLSPDGDPHQHHLPPPIKRMTRRYTMALLLNPSVWMLALLFATQFCCISAVLTHMVPLAIDGGMTNTDAGLLLTATATLAVVGKIVIGGASDRFPFTILLLLSIAFQALGVWLLFVMPAGDFWDMLPGALSFGLGFGGAVPLQNQLFARNFGSSMALAMGISRPMMLPIQLLGPPLAGLIYDLNGSYVLAGQLMLGALAVAVVLTLLQTRLLRR